MAITGVATFTKEDLKDKGKNMGRRRFSAVVTSF